MMSQHKSDSDASSSDDSSDSSIQSVHSDDSQLSFEFNEPNCKKRIDEFVQVTCTDSALAQYFLQDRKWNVVRAVNDYFREMRKKAKKKRQFVVFAQKDSSSGEADDENDTADSKKIKTAASTSASHDQPSSSGRQSSTASGEDKVAPKLFRHITWNIDGMNDKNLKIRTEAVCNAIIKEKASFVFFQEVTPPSERIIRQNLSNKFEIFSGNEDNATYYTMTLIEKVPFIKIEQNSILNFKETLMGRNLIKTNVSFGDVKFCLLNTHLESAKEGANQRVQQLSFILQHFKVIKPDVTIIAGGDLNLRDKELVGIGGLPPNVIDAWVETGRRKEVEFTWDMLRNDNLPYYEAGAKRQFKPRMRFDRVFIRKTFPVRAQVVHFGLVGIERLKPHVCFPSDHWGVITSYQIYNK